MKRLAWLPFMVAASGAAADLTMTLEREHIVLEKPVTLILRGAPETIRLERAGGTVALPLLVATRLDGACVTGASGCDELRIDFGSGDVEFRSFARSKGIRAQLDGVETVWEGGPLRINSRRRKTLPALTIAITSSGRESLRFAATVDGRTLARSVEHRNRTAPASLAPLVLLLHDVLASSDRVARSTGADVDEPPPQPPSGGGSGTTCSICDFCRHQAGGDKVFDCLGPPGGGGLLGGGGGRKPPKSCTVSAEEALRVFADVLRLELGVIGLCTGTTSAGTTMTSLFSGDATKFKDDVTTTPTSDVNSFNCAFCFQEAARRYEASGGGTSSLRSVLKPKCVNTYAKLKDSLNKDEYDAVLAQATLFREELAGCKRTCDSGPPASAPHRAYCGCITAYLAWESSGPRPGDPGCPP